MAFKTPKEGFVAQETRIAYAEPYRVTSADEARALFRSLKTEDITSKRARYEKTLRILEAEPNNFAVRAALAVRNKSDALTWNFPIFEEQAVEDAVRILATSRSSSVATDVSLRSAIIEVLERYIRNGDVDGVLDVNNGWCEEFATDVLEAFGTDKTKTLQIIDNHDLLQREWVAEMLSDTRPPYGLSWDDLDNLGVVCEEGGHVWIVLDGRSYDADAPDGVANALDLPIFRRNVVNALREDRPEFLKKVAHEPWWAESIAMHEAYKNWIDQKQVEPSPSL